MKLKIFLFILSLALQILPSPALAQALEAERHILDNGLVVIIKESHTSPVVALNCLVKAGSTTEGEYTGSGISHFIEHMLFKGTKKRAPGQIARQIRSLGGKIHGFTSFDYTGYEVVVPSQHFDEALDILSDALMNSAFPQEELANERSVILNELRMNLDDPERYLSRLFWSLAFRAHPYRHPVIGYETLFSKLTRVELIDYYRRMYVPNNIVLAIVGNVDRDKALSKLKRASADFQMGALPPHVLPAEPPQMSQRRLIDAHDVKLAHLTMGFHGPSVASRDLYGMDVLATILGHGRSSRLYKSIKEEKGLVHSIYAWSYTPKDPGIFGITALLDNENLDNAVGAILAEIEKVKRGPIHREELARARKRVLADFIFSQETVEDQARRLVIDEVVAGDFNFSKRYVEGINSVTKAAVKDVAKRYLSRDNLTITALVPKPTEPIEGAVELKAEAPPIRREVLENGLVVLLKIDETLPIISMRAVFAGGLRVEPKPGLSNFCSRMLLKGTKNRDAAQITDAIESIGGQISTYGGRNSFGASLELLSDDLEIGLDVLADILRNSTFPQDQIERTRATIVAQIRDQEDEIFGFASRALAKTLYGVHPYRFQPEGTIESVSEVDRDDLLEFYNSYVTSKNMVLAIFGDIDPDRTLEMVKIKFKGLNSKSLPAVEVPQEPKQTSRREATEDMEKLQAFIMLGFHTIDIKDEDRYVFDVITNLLSGQGSRLFEAVREELGLAYMVGSYHILGLDPGYYVIYASCEPANVEEVRSKLIDQIEALRQAPVTAEELGRAKQNLIGLWDIEHQSNGDLAFQTALDELYGLGYQDYKGYPAKVDAVTEKDILRVAREYFELKNLTNITVKPQDKPLQDPPLPGVMGSDPAHR